MTIHKRMLTDNGGFTYACGSTVSERSTSDTFRVTCVPCLDACSRLMAREADQAAAEAKKAARRCPVADCGKWFMTPAQRDHHVSLRHAGTRTVEVPMGPRRKA